MLKKMPRARRAILPYADVLAMSRKGMGIEYIAAVYGVTEATVTACLAGVQHEVIRHSYVIDWSHPNV